MLTSGGSKRRYSSTSTENTRNTPAITAMMKLTSISICHLAWPTLIFCTPSGRFFIDGSWFTFCIASDRIRPGARSAPIVSWRC